MIQRIQSLLLLVAGIIFASLFSLPFASSEESFGAVYENLTLDINDNIGLQIITGLGVAISLLTIFLFRNRKLQSAFSYLVMLLGLALTGLAYYIFNSVAPVSGVDASASLGLGMGLPIISTLMAFVANIFIKKDDKLVKSMDRLR